MRAVSVPALVLLLAVSSASSIPLLDPEARAAGRGAESLSPQSGSAPRLIGPRGERVPVLNEGGVLIRLRAVDASGAEVRASEWRSDSPDVGVACPGRA